MFGRNILPLGPLVIAQPGPGTGLVPGLIEAHTILSLVVVQPGPGTGLGPGLI